MAKVFGAAPRPPTTPHADSKAKRKGKNPEDKPHEQKIGFQGLASRRTELSPSPPFPSPEGRGAITPLARTISPLPPGEGRRGEGKDSEEKATAWLDPRGRIMPCASFCDPWYDSRAPEVAR